MSDPNEVAKFQVMLGKPGVPNKNGDIITAEVWDAAVKKYLERMNTGKRRSAEVVFPVDSISTSPEYTCQNCDKDYLYVDAVANMDSDDECDKNRANYNPLSCCSVKCADEYRARYNRNPTVGGEIRLGEPQLCVLGFTEAQIQTARSELVEKLMAEDGALVYSALGDVPFVKVGENTEHITVEYVVTAERLDLLLRLFRLRSKLPPGFKIVANSQ